MGWARRFAPAVALALGVKALVLLLGALGVATLWEAVFADVGVLRFRRGPDQRREHGNARVFRRFAGGALPHRPNDGQRRHRRPDWNGRKERHF